MPPFSFIYLEMFTVERILSRDKYQLPKNEHHHLESVGEGNDSGRESLSDIDPGEEGRTIYLILGCTLGHSQLFFLLNVIVNAE